MKRLHVKQLVLTSGYVVVDAAFLYAFGDMSWKASLGLSIAFVYALWLRDELEDLRRLFEINDAKLVRLSDRVNNLDEERAALEQAIARLQDNID